MIEAREMLLQWKIYFFVYLSKEQNVSLGNTELFLSHESSIITVPSMQKDHFLNTLPHDRLESLTDIEQQEMHKQRETLDHCPTMWEEFVATVSNARTAFSFQSRTSL